MGQGRVNICHGSRSYKFKFRKVPSLSLRLPLPPPLSFSEKFSLPTSFSSSHSLSFPKPYDKKKRLMEGDENYDKKDDNYSEEHRVFVK